VDAAIAGLVNARQKIGELWGCREEPTGDGALYAQNFTSILDNNTATGWVNVAMTLCNPMLWYVFYCGQL
jgi:hypothetical protein